MTTADVEAFEGELVSRTAAYLDRIEECVSHVPRLLDQYADGGPYCETVDRIGDLESDCDEIRRTISALISNADAADLGIRLTRVHLNTGPTIELYQRLDEVADTAERFAEELAAIEPSRATVCLDLLRRMAERAVEAVSVLDGAVTEYMRVLCDPYRTAALGEEVERIRTIESECDGLRNEVVATAFDGGASTPLVYREFAVLLDALVDGIEDVTDQLVWIAGRESGISVDPERR
ncbi:MAG: DUF47 domain-containing protein [Haloferacaceae archaeon]